MKKAVNAIVFCIALATFGFLPSNAAGQSGELDATLEQAIVDSLVNAGFDHSYLLAGLDAELQVTHEKILQERRGWLSSFRLGVQFFSFDTDYQTNTTRAGILPSLGLNLQVDIERLANNASLIRTAKSDARRVGNEILKQRRAMRLWITETYVQYRQSIEVVAHRKAILETQLEQEKLVEARFKRGECKLDDVLKIRTAIEQTREGIIRTEAVAESLLNKIEIFTNAGEGLPVGS